MQLLFGILFLLFIFSLLLVFKAYQIKSNEISFTTMLFCTIAIAFIPFCESEIVRASETSIFSIAKVHILTIQLIIFLSVISLWYSRKQFLKNKITRIELTFPWIYSFLTLYLLILYFNTFDKSFSFKRINGLWAYHIENEHFYKIALGLWLAFSLGILMLHIYSAYKKAIINEKKYWLKWLLLSLTIVPGMMFYLFFLSNKFGYSYFLYSPFLIVCSYAWVFVYSNFKLFEASPINALSNILDNIPNIVMTIDLNYRIKYINRLGNLELKKENKRIIGKSLQLLLRMLGYNSYKEMLHQINKLKKGKSFVTELNIYQKFYYEVCISPIYTKNNKKSGYVLIAHNITEIKEQKAKLIQVNNELTISNKDLEQFAYIASHDLKTPLRNIVNFSQLLQMSLQKKKYDKMPEYLDFIIRYGKNMNQIISDVLEMSLVQKKSLSITKVDIGKVIESVKVSLDIKIEQRNVIIKYQNVPSIFGNESQLKQVFQNLIENGIKYNDSKVPEINISYCSLIEHKHKFIISDNGIGFDQKYADDVFKMFRRLHSTNKYNGSGIGLSLCKKIIQAHGGSISVSSEKGTGTSVSFVIPIEIKSENKVLIKPRDVV